MVRCRKTLVFSFSLVEISGFLMQKIIRLFLAFRQAEGLAKRTLEDYRAHLTNTTGT